MKTSPVYVIQTRPESKSRYGDYEVFSTMEELTARVGEDESYYKDKPAWEVNLNTFKTKRVQLAVVVLA